MALTQIDDRGLKTPIDLLDNEKIRFGTGNDLELYHDGTRSWVRDNGSGNLIIDTDGSEIDINSGGNAEYMARFIKDGSVELYHNNVKKFYTIASGTITSGHSYLLDNNKVILGSSDDFQLFHDGSHSWLKNNTGYLRLAAGGSGVTINNSDNSEINAAFIKNGPVDLYYDNVKKFETTSIGVTLTGDFTNNAGSYINNSGGHVQIGHDSGRLKIGASQDLQLYHNGTNSVISETTGHLRLQTHTTGKNIVFEDGTSGEYYAIFNQDGACELYYDNSKKLETASYGASVTGNLGVNTTSPTVGYGGDVGLHIHSSATSGTRGSSIHLTSGTSGTTAADGSRINTSDNDLVIQNMENGRLDLGTNGTHRLTIKGDGKIGINGDSPVNLLTISNSGQQTDSVGNLQIRYTGSESTYNSGLTTKSYSGTGQFMQWSTGGLRIGSRIITNSGIGNLYFTTGNDSVRAQLTGDGLILNGSDTAAANALDDYEEGTFTPTLPSGGTITNYYSGYTRVGRLVNWWVYCYFSSVPDNTTTFKIGGIPFNVGNHGGSGNYGGTGSFAYSSDFNVNKWNVVTWGGNDYINFYWNDGSNSGASVKNESLTGATRYLALGGSYYA